MSQLSAGPLATVRALLLATAALVAPVAAQAAPVHVVAAENFYGDVARQIGGDKVDVTSILSNPDQDPHLFETNASTARAIEEADIVVSNGADYDPWMGKLLSASTKPKRVSIVAADLVGAKSGDNPHLWYAPTTLPAVAKALATALEARDPADAATFRANLARFEKSFTPIDAAIAAIRARHAGLKITATEPVCGYMAKALGFTMLNEPFQVAVMNNAEPSASEVAAFEKSLTDHEAKLMIYNAQVTDKTTGRLQDMAKSAGIPVVGVTETEPKDATVQAWFTGQLDAIKKALDAKAM